MLDSSHLIKEIDKGSALAVVAGQPGQLKHELEFTAPSFDGTENIVVAGMGGSVLGAEFVRAWLGDRLQVPLTIVRDYDLPKFVNEKTLAIISSYSGNTEETLSAYEGAKKAGASIVIISAGGKLLDIAKAGKHPHVHIPPGMQPRLSVLAGVRALTNVLESLKLVEGALKELEEAADWVMPELSGWVGDTPTSSNQAKQIARKLLGFPVVIYAGPTLGTVAQKWKININENAKNVAFYNQLPEFNHNEFQGWLNPLEKNFKVIELISDLDHQRVQKRFAVSNRLLSGNMPAPIMVSAKGKTRLEQMLWATLLGDFVSVYLAFLNQVDPTPVELVEKLKKELE